VTFAAGRVVPILRIFDRARAREFYVDFLGCTVDWTHTTGDDGPTYTQVSRGELVLHLSEHHGDGSPGVGVWVAATGVRELHAELTAKDYPFLRPGLCSSPGTDSPDMDDGVSMTLLDPFGNRIVLDERA
jgi:catechol 2,3-dioxygenase-like lactoylglutathione lyase family enzyme